MSKRVEARIQCPSCGLSKQMSLYRSLWVEDQANLALVMSDTLNLFECARCGLREQLPFAVLCTNVKRSIAIWYEPEPDPAVDDDIRQYTARFGPNHFFSRAERIADWEHFKRRLSELLNAGQHAVSSQPISAARSSAVESAQRSSDRALHQHNLGSAQMKVFVLVLVAATVIGGFVGGEISDRTFSILGAVVGGVGTATVLLSLGAYFTAQEKRRKKEDLPPEMRQVFNRMFGSPAEARALVSATAKWKPRPFHHNKSKSDEAEWFANAPEWSRIDSRLITVLIDRLHGNPMFEVFVHASQDCDIVAKYKPLSTLFDRGVGDVAALPRVAEILCTAGVDQGTGFAELMKSRAPDKKKMGRLYENAINACEAAIYVEPKYFVAYLRLAELRRMLGNKGDAITFCEKGLAQIQLVSAHPLPSRPGMELRQAVDEVKVKLESMLHELRA